MKKLIAILAVILMFTVLLTACGKKDKDKATDDAATKDSTSSSSAAGAAKSATELPLATTVVTETTAKGNTIEKDTEGNVIEIDSDNEIVSIKNAEGESLNIPEYLETHYFVSSNGKVYGDPSNRSADAGKSSQKSSSSSKSADDSKGSGSSSSKADEKSSSSTQERKEYPTEIAEIPKQTDEYELPIL